MHEGIPILNFLVPKEFTHEGGRLTGVDVREGRGASTTPSGRRNLVPTGEPDVHIPCDDVLVAIGQENAFPWIERDIGIEFDHWGMPKVDPMTMQSTLPNVFFGGDAAFGPKNIIWAVAHGHDAAISIDKFCHGEDVERPAAAARDPGQPEDGHPRVELRQRHLQRPCATRCRCATRRSRSRTSAVEVELGYDEKLGYLRGRALPQLRRRRPSSPGRSASSATPASTSARWTASPSPTNGEEDELRARLTAPALNLTQDLYIGNALKTGRIMAKDEDVCLHCGLCAERCPTGAWDMQQIPHRHDTGRTGMPKPIEARQRLRRQIRQRQRLGLGERQPAVRQVDPAHGHAGELAQHLPVEHPGPADLVRGADLRGRPSRPARRRRPDGGDEPADLGPGRRRDRARRLPALRLRPSRCRPRSSATTSP